MAEGREYEPLPAHLPADTPLRRMIGIAEQHVKIGEQQDDGVQVEKWQHPSLETPDEIDFSEAYSPNMVTIHYDSANRPVYVCNGEEWTGEEDELDGEILLRHALDYLYRLFPDAPQHFWMVKPDVDEEWEELEEFVEELMDELDELNEEGCPDEDEEWIDGPDESEEEDAQEFFFQFHLNGVPVEGHTVLVSVGRYSGRIITSTMEPTEELPPADTRTVPVLTKQQAREKLVQQMKMKLEMMMEFDEEGKTFYKLTYLPSFPETDGHVRMIDAENGKAYYMDMGGSIFY
ncbi:hypothetical protein [Sporosarcina sp.]|uniref:hypothetical protein n=1 Tax=Sporosarcina sp. TaxID=49982 RepID=UPI00262A8D4D|nr:hypothetical protein [Sporosarcina sp.]